MNTASDNLQVIKREDNRMEKFSSEKGCVRSGFGYAVSGEIREMRDGGEKINDIGKR